MESGKSGRAVVTPKSAADCDCVFWSQTRRLLASGSSGGEQRVFELYPAAIASATEHFFCWCSIFPTVIENFRFMKYLIQYLYEIKLNKAILWCYLIWYIVVVYFYFDPSLKLWINAIGISAVIGTALLLSVSSGKIGKRDNWQIFRLYLMPFCVSSFSALIKDQGFIVIVSPKIKETLVAISCCVLFLSVILVIKLIKKGR